MEHDSRTRASGDRQADTLEWKTYDFKYKLNANESGASLVFHLPRLDRRLWVLPVEARRGQSPPSWFYAFLDRLLLNEDEDVLGLLKHNPFAGSKPPYKVRSRIEDFRPRQTHEPQEACAPVCDPAPRATPRSRKFGPKTEREADKEKRPAHLPARRPYLPPDDGGPWVHVAVAGKTPATIEWPTGSDYVNTATDFAYDAARYRANP